MTHREYLAWQEWLDAQWNEPDKLCDYVRQVSFDLRRINAKDPKAVRFDETKIAYKQQRSGAAALTPEQIAQRMEASRTAWGAFLGASTGDKIKRKR